MWLVQALIPYGLNIMKKEEGESSLILVVGKFVIMPPRGHIAKIFFCNHNKCRKGGGERGEEKKKRGERGEGGKLSRCIRIIIKNFQSTEG